MNQEWSELNKTMQLQIKKETTFAAGIAALLDLREKLMEELLSIKREISPADFSAMPFPNAKGYHSKTIAYSVNALLGCHDLALSCCHEIAKITVMEGFL